MSFKGWIKNLDTSEKMSFQYNPEAFDRGAHTATYGEFSAPGSSYPETAFLKGNARVFPLTLFLNDNPNTGLITNQVVFLESLLPPESRVTNFKKPPEVIFCMGKFIRTCVVTSLGVVIDRYDANQNPVQATISLEFRVVIE